MTLKPIWISIIFQEVWVSWFHITWEQNLNSLACGRLEWKFVQFQRSFGGWNLNHLSTETALKYGCLRASFMPINIGNSLAQDWCTLST